jgi:hypothetical protein
MKLLAAHTSPTLAATLAAAAISLSVFLLPGSAIQSGATPLLPALDGAARVPANLPAVVHRRRSKPVVQHVSASSHVDVSRPAPRAAPQRRAVTRTVRPVQRRVPVRRVEHPVVASATVAPVVSAAPKASNALVHDRGHRQRTFALAPRAHGHGKAPGHSAPAAHEHGQGHEQHGHGDSAPPPIAAAHGNGGGNGNGHGKGER